MSLEAPLLSSEQKLVPGIIGGVRPLPAIAFEKLLLDGSIARGASQDQEHFN